MLKRLSHVILLSLLFTAASCAQQPPAQTAGATQEKQPGTTLETFLGKRGKIFVKDSYNVGRVSGLGSVEMEALVIYEPNSSVRTKGLRVTVTENGRFERTNISFIDFDELESLSQALAYMIDLSGKWSTQQREVYTEVTYVSRGDFQIGFWQRGAQLNAFCSSGTVGKASAFPKLPELASMKGLVDSAITLLKSK